MAKPRGARKAKKDNSSAVSTNDHHCKVCPEIDDDQMVACDVCEDWFHYGCVNVTADIADVPWQCSQCSTAGPSTSNVIASSYNPPSVATNPATTISPINLQPSLDAINDIHPAASELNQDETEIRSTSSKSTRRRAELELKLVEERRALASKRIAQSIAQQAQVDEEYLEDKFRTLVADTTDSEDEEPYIVNDRTTNWTNNVTVTNGSTNIPDPRNMNVHCTSTTVPTTNLSTIYRKTITTTTSNAAIFNQAEINQIHSYRPPPANTYRPHLDTHASTYARTNIPANTTRNPYINSTIIQPTAASPPATPRQLSARHSLPKELPIFGGKPEEWPLFISAFENSTRVCGFSLDENLIRLQKCLKGNALEAVRSQLMLPKSVPDIISTLRLLYGRPEQLIYTMLHTIRESPSPKSDKLDSLISFALSVKNLTAVAEASELHDHMNNPMLLQELVNKLPAQIKLNWAMHKRMLTIVNISTFGEWIFELARAASEVVMPEFDREPERKTNKSRSTTNKHHLHAHSDDYVKHQSASDHHIEKCSICKDTGHQTNNCNSLRSMKLEDRWTAVKRNHLCRRCLGSHHTARCRSTALCGINGCIFKHNPLLHNNKKEQPSLLTVAPSSSAENNCNAHRDSQQSILFRIVPVTLHNGNKSISTYAFMDEGSSVTLLEESTAKELNLKGTPDPLCLKWTADVVRSEDASHRVCLEISEAAPNAKRYKISGVRTVSKLNLPTQSISVAQLQREYRHLRDVPLQDYTNAIPTILIGLEHWKLCQSREIREGPWRQPAATKTLLGWTILGCHSSSDELGRADNHYVHHSFHICECKADADKELHQSVKSFFSLENMGVKVPEKALDSIENTRAIRILESTTSFLGNRYETGLLWKFDDIVLPDSRPMAIRRLHCLEKKMANNPELAANLNKQMENYLKKGYVRKLTPEECNVRTRKTWYLPLFAVINPSKPGKVRMVWDAAAKSNGVSLNEVLLSGPDLLVSLLHVLFKFREKPIAICADICEMFHRVNIRDQDREAQRFLWPNPKNKSKPDTYVMQVMTFGATCSPSAAQFVKNKHADRFIKEFPRAVRSIKENHYVDDLLDCVDTVEEGVTLAKQIAHIHGSAGFELHNWLSNSRDLLDEVAKSTPVSPNKNMNITNELQTEKILGMWWRTSNDTFTYSLKLNQTNKGLLTGADRPTKREVLRILMSIFDPLGLITFFLIYVKILLQEIWRSNIEWDDEITNDQYEKWLVWIRILPHIENITIPRCYASRIFHRSTQLHVFVDASENAYAAVAYFRIESEQGIKLALIGAKSKVAPQKLLSIPRLELQAALLGARLAKTIISGHTLDISKKYLWSDSRTVLCWIRSDQRRYKQFVAFRISEILELSDTSDWKWVPTKMNIADEATKWKKHPEISPSSRWFSGPAFLLKSEAEWPQDNNMHDKENIEELRYQASHIVKQEPPLIDVTRFSSWKRILRTQAYVCRFVHNVTARKSKTTKNISSISYNEYRTAENVLYRQAQSESFYDEITRLSKNKSINKSSNIYKFSPYLDDEKVLRMRGRTDAAACIDINTKRPIILPKNHRITRLIIEYYHRRFHHHNHETVVNEIRQKYVVPNLRVALRKIRSLCQECKNRSAIPTLPEMADLPAARMSTFIRPFSYVGIDYFGPMFVKIGRRVEKRWGAIITCLTVRAIHIELAHSLSTDSAIMVIRNFIARRGMPIEIYSDNGTNFRGASKELQMAVASLNNEKLMEEFTTSDTKWFFNPPAAPHMGGCWERMVRSVKSTLAEVLPSREPSEELLRSALCEIENVINSRPLTYIPLDTPEDEALTPNHFLLGSSNGNKPPGKFEGDRLLRKNWHIAQQISNQFWRRWVREYLPTITRRTKWFDKVKNLEKGDVVLICDESSPRNCWPKGIIIDTIVGSGQQVRQATIQTVKGVYTRPAAKLAVLDVQNGSKSSEDALVYPAGACYAAATSFSSTCEKRTGAVL